MLLEIKHGVVIVPVAAVQRGPQGAYVWIVGSDGTASMRTVTLGISEGGNQQITKGLAPGDRVVTDGEDKLQDGSKVTVRAEAPAAAPAGTPQ